MTTQGRSWTTATIVAVVVMVALGGAAFAANRYQVSRVQISPAGDGSEARPLPVHVRFGLRVTDEDRAIRPGAIKTYIIGTEGVVAFPKAFPACSLGKVKRRHGPARACREAKIGDGFIRAAAGFEDDNTIAESLPCNLNLRVYNIGTAVALRLDTDVPVPPSFKSRRVGCPVPVHTAIKGSLVSTTIDGVGSMDLSFTLPPLLLHPLQDWEGALQVVDAALGGQTAQARVRGRTRKVGFFSAIGCHGGSRTTRAAFINAQGERAEATRTVKC